MHFGVSKNSKRMEKVKVFQKGGGGGREFGNIYSKISQNSRPVEGSSIAGDTKTGLTLGIYRLYQGHLSTGSYFIFRCRILCMPAPQQVELCVCLSVCPKIIWVNKYLQIDVLFKNGLLVISKCNQN